MALTINQFVGFETGGLEEASSTAGSPDATEATVVRSGIRSLKLPHSGDSNYLVAPFDIVADAGDDYVFGFGFRSNDVSPSTNTEFIQIQEAGSNILGLILSTGGSLVLVDTNGNTSVTVFQPFTNNTWHYIEVYFQHLNSGSATVFIDNALRGSISVKDFSDGGTLDSFNFRQISGNTSSDFFFDDFYFLSGATASSDRLTPCEVFGYQNDNATATADDGAVGADPGTLDTGNWDDSAETPANDTNNSNFSVTAADSGVAYADGGSRAGPSGDANINGDSNIKAWKGIWRADRTGGSGTTHTIYIGNDSDVTDGFDSTTVTLLSGTVSNFFLLSETDPPLSTENFAQGFGKTSGGRDFDNREMWATLLHVPSSVLPFPPWKISIIHLLMR